MYLDARSQVIRRGCTINVGVHLVDMFRIFSLRMPREVISLMGNFTWNLPIEDYSSMILRSPKSVCTIEAGYTHPAPYITFDARFSLRISRHYIVARNDDTVEIHRGCDGHMEQCATQVVNAPWYPVFVSESIDRFAKGQAPVADLNDLVEVMKVIDAAYASDRAGGTKLVLGDQGWGGRALAAWASVCRGDCRSHASGMGVAV